MPHASHRLDLVLLPVDPEAEPDRPAFADFANRWSGRLEQAIVGGARGLRLDDPGRVSLYANQQGGFRVRCPRSGENLASAFSAAVERWRSGAPRAMCCPACGEEHALEEITLIPPGGFARFAVVFVDAATLNLEPEPRAELESALGPLREIARRIS